MSADDDTFDIDIYGDDVQDDQQQPGADYNEPPNGDAQADHSYGDGTAYDDQEPFDPAAEDLTANGAQGTTSESAAQDASTTSIPANASSGPQGLKRKAPDDEADGQYQQRPDTRPLDPGALPALKLTEFGWWNTEEDLRAFCSAAGVEHELREVAFGEHKINGKSRGEVYLQFDTSQAATAVKREVEKSNSDEGTPGPHKTKVTVYFTPIGNPFKGYTKDGSGAGAKKDFNTQGGAYNNFNGHRGGSFQNRGNFGARGNFQARGNFNNNMMQSRPQQQSQQGWGMGGMQNPMMAGFNPMMAGMGNMMGMNRGSMMGGGMMAGRGGYGMGMGNMGGMSMNMMGGRGGGMMGGGMGRGGYGAGMQQGYGMNGGTSPQNGGMNKKPRTE